MVRKIILTGAPGSGKSSILKELEYVYGERIIPEAAEDVIKYLQARGDPEPWKNSDFQDKILRLQIQRERQVENLEGRVFIDRGILDGLAYYQIDRREPTLAMRKAIEESVGRYAGVFLIDGGNDCEKTKVRREDNMRAMFLQYHQDKNYMAAGYKVEVIPYIGMEKRTKMIMESLILGGKK